LALAIMESQRQMMMGGYGHPDGQGADAGVSDESKSRWLSFAYKELRDKQESRLSSSYGSLQQQDESENSEDKPHCSICLGEYEEGEALFKLPCGHIFHAECINSWCSSHTRCPLCNLDLAAEPPKTASAEQQV
jgi:Ring finger domain